MTLIRIRTKGQLTLPDSIRRLAHIAEGDVLEATVEEAGIVLRPKKLVDASQAWFWTEEWQAGERRASEDIRTGKTSPSTNANEFLDSLD
jgi:AbrB family looped-hinge helix DNA binding protein